MGTTHTMPPADPPLNEASLTRIAAAVVAAPVACCLAGLAVLTLAKHRQSSLIARYAAWHLAPVPVSAPDTGNDAVPGFLAGPHGAQFVFARNPAQWGYDLGFLSFFVTAVVLVAGAAMAYAAVTRRRGIMLGALAPLAVLAVMACLQLASLRMYASGYEVAFDRAGDTLSVNGHPVAALTGVRCFRARVVRSTRSADWYLEAVRQDGSTAEVGGPAAPYSVTEAARAMNAALVRALGHEPARTPQDPALAMAAQAMPELARPRPCIGA